MIKTKFRDLDKLTVNNFHIDNSICILYFNNYMNNM